MEPHHSINIMPAPSRSGTTPAPRKTSQLRLRELLCGEGTFGTVLLAWCFETWGSAPIVGPEETRWGPETLREELELEIGGRLPDANFDRLMATIAILTTDLFFQDLKAFLPLAAVLSGDTFEPETFVPADVMECAWAVTEATLLIPPEEGEEAFSDEIRHYLTFALQDEGFLRPPGILKMAIGADFSDKVNYAYADDPELFEAIWQTQSDKTSEVETTLFDGLTNLLQQLKSLPFQRGKTTEIEKHILALQQRRPAPV